MEQKGLIHIYTGEGKGKTTSAFGLALRVCRYGKKIIIFQFLKSIKFSSSCICLGNKKNKIKIIKFKQVHPFFKPDLTVSAKKEYKKKLKKQIKKDFTSAIKKVKSGKYDLAVFDEIINAVDGRYIFKKDILKFIKSKPRNLELVLTGRGDIRAFIKKADYITEFKKIKHPFDKGISARKAIEY